MSRSRFPFRSLSLALFALLRSDKACHVVSKLFKSLTAQEADTAQDIAEVTHLGKTSQLTTQNRCQLSNFLTVQKKCSVRIHLNRNVQLKNDYTNQFDIHFKNRSLRKGV